MQTRRRSVVGVERIPQRQERGDAPGDVAELYKGVQFTARQFTATLENAGVIISMDGRGRMFDNIFIEWL